MLSHKLWRLFPNIFRPTFRRSLADVERAGFAYLNDKDLNHFRSLIGPNNVLVEELDAYNTDFMRWYKGY
jgi:hypothetical protein